MGIAELHTIVTSDFADRIHGRSADSRALKKKMANSSSRLTI